LRYNLLLGLFLVLMPLSWAHAPVDFEQTCLKINHQRFTVQVARTPIQQQRGLQFRTRLSPHHGMVFVYPEPQIRTFWMKDCRIPLDLLFFRAGQLVDTVDHAPPCQKAAEACPLYVSRVPADTIVELNAGTRQHYGWNVGQTHLSRCLPYALQ
jgi:uncharacterized membrane protein (UPF0127 family)